MERIFKTWKKATYFEGEFALRSRYENWAHPVDFPTVFTAYGAAIKNGNWQRCTAINTPDYVINNFSDGIGNRRRHAMGVMWEYCKRLEKTTWKDVAEDEEGVKELIRQANTELYKLPTLR